jgi:HEAT repeat protein
MSVTAFFVRTLVRATAVCLGASLAMFNPIADRAEEAIGAVIPRFDQTRDAATLAKGLEAADPAARTRAACGLRELGTAAAAAIPALVALLGDGAAVDPATCSRPWRGMSGLTTTPGEEAAAALVSIGSRAFEPVMNALKHSVWIARRNAAWALGAFADRRAVDALLAALGDTEAAVREQVAWALGALRDRRAVDGLLPLLKDADPGVRRQAAWAIGVVGSRR